MATKQDIRNQVLRRLKVLPAGQTADSEDASIVETAYDNLHALLTEREVINWGASDDIPSEAVLPIVSLVADAVADEFLTKNDEQRRIRLRLEAYGQTGNAGAFSDLQRLIAVPYVSTPVEADYM